MQPARYHSGPIAAHMEVTLGVAEPEGTVRKPTPVTIAHEQYRSTGISSQKLPMARLDEFGWVVAVHIRSTHYLGRAIALDLVKEVHLRASNCSVSTVYQTCPNQGPGGCPNTRMKSA